jgi:ABC-2 type transport system ATP-binding protein
MYESLSQQPKRRSASSEPVEHCRVLSEIEAARRRAIREIKEECESSRRLIRAELDWNGREPGELAGRGVAPRRQTLPLDVTTIAISDAMRRALEGATGGRAAERRTDPRGSIEVVQLVREFKGLRAIDGINLHVESGEIYGFLGPNGAGKSTTVQILTTLLAPTSGKVSVGGFDVTRQGAVVRAAIGAALQEAALDPMLTGREHLRLQAALHGVGRGERSRRAEELLRQVGLEDAADRRVGGYSGGMKRRLDLGLALVHRPAILFLDEPTTGLDPQSRAALWEEVKRLSTEEGVTVFLTTQYLEEADVLADRVGIIDHGRIVAEGTPDGLKAEIGHASVEVASSSQGSVDALRHALARFGEPREEGHGRVKVQLPRGEGQFPEVVRALDEAAVGFDAIHLHAPSLDEVFLAKTGRKLEGGGAAAAAGDDAVRHA